jgi:hypothetical protein
MKLNKLLSEIWQIRQEIKSSTQHNCKENMSASVLNTYTKLSNCEIDSIMKDREDISNRSNYAMECLKNKLGCNVEKSRKEHKDFNSFKRKYDNDVKQMEADLDKRLNEIKTFNTQRITDNKNLAKSHKEEIKELEDYYEDRLHAIRKDQRKSKNTFKELIVSRETELVRINKDTDA